MRSPRRFLEHALLKAKLRLTPVNPEATRDLFAKLDAVPGHRPEIDGWHLETAELIHKLVLSRISADDLASILAGLVAYRKTGITPEAAHQSLVSAYCNTSGQWQDLLHRALFGSPSAPVPESIVSPAFGALDRKALADIISGLRRTGYAVLPFSLPKASVEAIRRESKGFAYNLRDRLDPSLPGRIIGIDPEHPPRAVAAYADGAQVSGSPMLSGLAHDPLILALVSAHLGSAAAPIDATLWYSFPAPEASPESAQMFHFDLDTLRWVKVFYYLSDVDPESGPHCYVEGTHEPGSKPASLLNAGYVRITDAEMEATYPGRSRTITGTAGTVIIGDTRCFHKGTRLSEGHRLIYSPIYAPSRIGYFHGTAKRA
jgi:hypothetical protein